MNVSDTIALALRNLRQAKLRTALTTMGVSIGIASLAGMVSLGVGLEEQTVGKVMSAGVFDSITVMPGQAGGRFGGFGARVGGGGLRARGRQGDAASDTPRKPLDDDAVAAIAALADVKEVYPNIRVAVEMQYDQFTGFATLAGVPMSSKQEGTFQSFTAGAFFADDKARACLLSLDLAKRITDKDPKDLIGQTVTVAYAAPLASPPAPAAPPSASAAPAAAPPPASGLGALAGAIGGAPARRVAIAFTIVGIVEREPGGPLAIGGGGISGLMIPLSQAKAIDAEAVTGRQSLLGPAPAAPDAKKAYSTLTVKVARASATMDVEDKVKGLGFSAFSVTDALQGAKRAFIILDIILSLIGSIALAVSSLGIVNTMVMSILERTREIGIMKAIGGSDADVRGIFLVEACSIGLLGGVCGIALGWMVGRVINFGANFYIRQQGGTDVNLFSLPLWLIGGAIGFSILVSLIAGSYPARRAARLNPIEALRHD